MEMCFEASVKCIFMSDSYTAKLQHNLNINKKKIKKFFQNHLKQNLPASILTPL